MPEPKRVLIVKTSSLGDLVHTFPALTDARAALPGVRFDWLAEEGFCEVPTWHPAVERVIPIAVRRWRKNWWQAWRSGAIKAFRKDLGRDAYDLVIDAQGLLKSALPGRWARGPLAGYDRDSIREPLASRLYQKRYPVSRKQHAITRNRQLFAAALGYRFDAQVTDYGLGWQMDRQAEVILLHASTWPSKHWPELYWAELAHHARQAGFEPLLPWHSPEERLRAERIQQTAGCGTLLPRLSLTEIAGKLAACAGAVGVDSGLAHIAAAVDTPAVTLYGPTSAKLTGAIGSCQLNRQSHLECAPCLRRECGYTGYSQVQPACFEEISPVSVWGDLQRQMKEAE